MLHTDINGYVYACTTSLVHGIFIASPIPTTTSTCSTIQTADKNHGLAISSRDNNLCRSTLEVPVATHK